MSVELEPKNKGNISKTQNLVLAIGLVLVIVGILMLVVLSPKVSIHKSFFGPVFMLVLGGLIVYFTFVNTQKHWMLFCGVFICLCAVLFLILESQISPWVFEDLWPVIVIIGGISLFASGLYRAKRMQLSFFVPSVVLLVLGILFLLFSMNVITVSFFAAVSRWWPLMFVFAGIMLVVLFLVWTKNGSHVVVAEEDDDDDFSDTKK